MGNNTKQMQGTRNPDQKDRNPSQQAPGSQPDPRHPDDQDDGRQPVRRDESDPDGDQRRNANR